MSIWLNTTRVLYPELKHPCETLNYCPYGEIVEEFPLSPPEDRDNKACPIFGHNCPVHYHAEFFDEIERSLEGS